MNKSRVIAASLLAGAALTAGTVLPASANSFGASVGGGTYSYADSTDAFCIRATAAYGTVSATLKPVKAGRGPTVTVSADAGDGTKCVSLARAYEDTKYTATVTSRYWVVLGGRANYSAKTTTFFS